MEDFSLPRRDVLVGKLRDLATRGHRDLVDDLELMHLVEVASNHLLLADILQEERIGRLISVDPQSGIRFFTELADRPGAVDDLLHQQVEAAAPEFGKVLGDGGQRGQQIRRLGDVVEAHDAGVAGDPPAGFGQRAQGTERHVVVAAEDRGHLGSAASLRPAS